MSEKTAENLGIAVIDPDTDGNKVSRCDDEVSWTPEEERKLIWKADLLVLPPLILGFFALQLDRGNIGNALTDFFFRDIGITQSEFNVGQQLLSLGIVLFEIPSNIVLYRVGPPIWIGCQIVAWGLIATFQAFVKGRAAFYATRFLLGAFESGFIPGGLYIITRWYTHEETSKRFSIYFLGNTIAGGSAGLIAYGILHMRGIQGLAGWQWLFLLEGIFTVLVGIFFIAFFPKSPENPTSILGVRLFSERESQILSARVLRDDPTKAHPKPSITKAEMKSVATNWRLIPHVILTLCGVGPLQALGSYGPSLIASYGYERLRSNALSSMGYWLLILTTIPTGYLADKWGKRGPLVLALVSIYFSLAVAYRVLITTKNRDTKLALQTLIIAFGPAWHPINGSWMALNSASAGERSITMAILIMGANLAGIFGKQLFQEKDAPNYPVGWSVIMGLVTLALLSTLVANAQYWFLNRRAVKRGGEPKYKP